MIKEIAFTSYRVTNMGRSREFYEKTLGLTLSRQWEEAWVEYDIGAATLALESMSENAPSGYRAMVGLEVDDFDATLAGLKAAGVSLKMEPYESPVCWMAMIDDPDGNALCIHKRKEKA